MNNETPSAETSSEALDLDRYGIEPDGEPIARRRERKQQAQKNHYFVKLPLRLFEFTFHRPITQILIVLWFEAALAKSSVIKASYQRAKRFCSLNCSRKTFYRALDQLEEDGLLTKTHVNGRSIEVRLHNPKASPESNEQ